MKKPNVIIFDAYGTLFKIDSDLTQINEILGENKSSFLDIWRRKLIEYSWMVSLMEKWESFNNIVRKALHYACKQFQIDPKIIIPVLMEVYENPILFEDAKELLIHLNKQQVLSCIMSNGEPQTLSRAIMKNGIDQLIAQVFSASAVNTFKVSPRVYRMATEFYNTGPSNMLFVSSNAWDITGAKNFGYKTAWVNRKTEIFDTVVDSPDYEFGSLTELSKIF